MKFLRNGHFNSKSKILAKISPRGLKFWLILYEESEKNGPVMICIPPRFQLGRILLTMQVWLLKKTEIFTYYGNTRKHVGIKILQQVNVAG